MMLAVFLMLVAGAFAQNCCSTEDRREVERLWQDIWSAEYTGRRVSVAQSIFADVLDRMPDAASMFQRVNVANPNSPEFKSHCVRVVNGLDIAINLLKDPATLNEQLAQLNMQHLARQAIGLRKAHFRAIAQSFLKVMPQVSACFNPDAWTRCFARIVNGITDGLQD